MPYKTALTGHVNVGGTAFELKADLPWAGGVAFAGSNSSALSFQDVMSSVLKLTGFALRLPGDFPELPLEEGALHVAVSPTGVSVSGVSAAEWKNPFGVLKALTLRNFQLEYSSVDRTLSLAARAEYGSVRSEGQLLFAGGELRVAVVTLQEITLGTILAMSLGIVWGPLNALILRGRDRARPIRLYYCDGPAYSGYEEGFRVDQAVIEIADHRADIALLIAGGKASLIGQFESDIDLKFLRLSAPGDSQPGPAISVDDKQRVLTLDSGVTFLGEELGRCEIAARPPTADGYELRGEIRSQVDIAIFKKPTFTFTWSRAKGFHIERWSIPNFPAELNYLELLNRLPAGRQCGAFESEMFKQSVRSTFDLEAKVEPGPDSGLRFTLSGKHRILVENDETLSLPLPGTLTVVLKPDQFSFAALAGAIGKVVEGAGTSLLAPIVDPKFPERSATFFGAVLVPQFATESTTLILCRGWSAPASIAVPGPSPEPVTDESSSFGPSRGAAPAPRNAGTADQYAAELKRTGLTCQQAATLIAESYPALGPIGLMELFRRHFPETTGTPLLMLWALGRAGVTVTSASKAFLMLFPEVRPATFAAAVRTAYPTPNVVEAVRRLQQSHTPASEAARRIQAAFPILTSIQIGYLLLMYFPESVPDAEAMGTALHAAGANARQVRAAVESLFPLLSPTEAEALLERVFEGRP